MTEQATEVERIHFSKAIRDYDNPWTQDQTVAYYSLMHIAHVEAVAETMMRQLDARDVDAYAQAVNGHMPQACAAFTAAASLKGWSLGRITEALEFGHIANSAAVSWAMASGVSMDDIRRLTWKTT